ncbi:type II toxin-antitoxin system PemK/MazF family toxin [Blastococcus sp. PRF04-17]|uniref:type II toxin-antitoxin system PemK/MazF family toxin n=1 Tax=Blastococcus sp. PRF04-17 TaxID=2933797 RepID=UPI001FF5DD63|nr:type II toxin-antitoxin system PemK/MazF family toxin [Blastococcus sp. PRF04-17]UOY01862.1 type II toxin-antitoxin system PemK/MazF family toxin [Blastococcus sp. PRF04-17]
MRPIHLASLDKTRPVLILTRELVRPHLARVTVAPITSTIRGLSTEVLVGPVNGLDHPSVISCDNVATIPTAALGRQIGRLLPEQEPLLTAALHAAFDLEELPPLR